MRIVAQIVILWLCTGLLTGQSAGFSQQDGTKFLRFVPGQQGLAGDYFLTAAEDDLGFIWIGGQTGLQRFDGYSFQSYSHLLHHSYVRVLCTDKSGRLWIATRNGLEILNPSTCEVKTYLHDPQNRTTLSNSSIEPILEDREGNIWIGTHNGLNEFIEDPGVFRRYYCDSLQGAGRENRYHTILQDRYDDNIFWLGSHRGLQKFHKKEGTFNKLEIPPSTSGNPDPNPEVLGLYHDESGFLWIGLGATNRLVRYDPVRNSWISHEIQGAPAPLTPNRRDGVFDIVPVSEHELLVSTVRSVGLFNTTDNSFRAYALGNDRDSAAVASATRRVLIDSKGLLWLPSLRGISRSELPLAHSNRGNARVQLTGECAAPASLQLEHFEEGLKMQFALINPVRPEEVEYQYRLIGLGNNWLATDSQHVRFNTLKPGDYQFEVRGREGDGAWSEITALPIHVERAWWQNSWLALGIVAIVLGVIIAFTWQRLKHRQREKAIRLAFEKELAEVQLDALRAQMNPHFLFNTMNSINHYILKSDPDAASDYLTKFSRLIRLILENSKSKTVKLSDELQALRLYIEIEQLRFDGDFQFDIHVDPAVQPERIQVPPLLFQPYVENAIWHGLMHKDGDRKLNIMVSTENGALHIIVRDNGIGREKAREYQTSLGKKKSLGMQITRDRMGLVNKLYQVRTEVEIIDLTGPAGEPLGTEVLITIPLYN